jgi:hypothetical protein
MCAEHLLGHLFLPGKVLVTLPNTTNKEACSAITGLSIAPRFGTVTASHGVVTCNPLLRKRRFDLWLQLTDDYFRPINKRFELLAIGIFRV